MEYGIVEHYHNFFENHGSHVKIIYVNSDYESTIQEFTRLVKVQIKEGIDHKKLEEEVRRPMPFDNVGYNIIKISEGIIWDNIILDTHLNCEDKEAMEITYSEKDDTISKTYYVKKGYNEEYSDYSEMLTVIRDVCCWSCEEALFYDLKDAIKYANSEIIKCESNCMRIEDDHGDELYSICETELQKSLNIIKKTIWRFSYFKKRRMYYVKIGIESHPRNGILVEDDIKEMIKEGIHFDK